MEVDAKNGKAEENGHHKLPAPTSARNSNQQQADESINRLILSTPNHQLRMKVCRELLEANNSGSLEQHRLIEIKTSNSRQEGHVEKCSLNGLQACEHQYCFCAKLQNQIIQQQQHMLQLQQAAQQQQQQQQQQQANKHTNNIFSSSLFASSIMPASQGLNQSQMIKTDLQTKAQTNSNNQQNSLQTRGDQQTRFVQKNSLLLFISDQPEASEQFLFQTLLNSQSFFMQDYFKKAFKKCQYYKSTLARDIRESSQVALQNFRSEISAYYRDFLQKNRATLPLDVKLKILKIMSFQESAVEHDEDECENTGKRMQKHWRICHNFAQQLEQMLDGDQLATFYSFHDSLDFPDFNSCVLGITYFFHRLLDEKRKGISQPFYSPRELPKVTYLSLNIYPQELSKEFLTFVAPRHVLQDQNENVQDQTNNLNTSQQQIAPNHQQLVDDYQSDLAFFSDSGNQNTDQQESLYYEKYKQQIQEVQAMLQQVPEKFFSNYNHNIQFIQLYDSKYGKKPICLRKNKQIEFKTQKIIDLGIPMPEGLERGEKYVASAEFLSLIDEIITPLVREHQPHFIVLSYNFNFTRSHSNGFLLEADLLGLLINRLSAICNQKILVVQQQKVLHHDSVDSPLTETQHRIYQNTKKQPQSAAQSLQTSLKLKQHYNARLYNFAEKPVQSALGDILTSNAKAYSSFMLHSQKQTKVYINAANLQQSVEQFFCFKPPRMQKLHHTSHVFSDQSYRNTYAQNILSMIQAVSGLKYYENELRVHRLQYQNLLSDYFANYLYNQLFKALCQRPTEASECESGDWSYNPMECLKPARNYAHTILKKQQAKKMSLFQKNTKEIFQNETLNGKNREQLKKANEQVLKNNSCTNDFFAERVRWQTSQLQVEKLTLTHVYDLAAQRPVQLLVESEVRQAQHCELQNFAYSSESQYLVVYNVEKVLKKHKDIEVDVWEGRMRSIVFFNIWENSQYSGCLLRRIGLPEEDKFLRTNFNTCVCTQGQTRLCARCELQLSSFNSAVVRTEKYVYKIFGRWSLFDLERFQLIDAVRDLWLKWKDKNQTLSSPLAFVDWVRIKEMQNDKPTYLQFSSEMTNYKAETESNHSIELQREAFFSLFATSEDIPNVLQRLKTSAPHLLTDYAYSNLILQVNLETAQLRSYCIEAIGGRYSCTAGATRRDHNKHINQSLFYPNCNFFIHVYGGQIKDGFQVRRALRFAESNTGELIYTGDVQKPQKDLLLQMSTMELPLLNTLTLPCFVPVLQQEGDNKNKSSQHNFTTQNYLVLFGGEILDGELYSGEKRVLVSYFDVQKDRFFYHRFLEDSEIEVVSINTENAEEIYYGKINLCSTSKQRLDFRAHNVNILPHNFQNEPLDVYKRSEAKIQSNNKGPTTLYVEYYSISVDTVNYRSPESIVLLFQNFRFNPLNLLQEDSESRVHSKYSPSHLKLKPQSVRSDVNFNAEANTSMFLSTLSGTKSAVRPMSAMKGSSIKSGVFGGEGALGVSQIIFQRPVAQQTSQFLFQATPQGNFLLKIPPAQEDSLPLLWEFQLPQFAATSIATNYYQQRSFFVKDGALYCMQDCVVAGQSIINAQTMSKDGLYKTDLEWTGSIPSLTERGQKRQKQTSEENSLSDLKIEMQHICVQQVLERGLNNAQRIIGRTCFIADGRYQDREVKLLYMFGGHELRDNGSKSFTNKCERRVMRELAAEACLATEDLPPFESRQRKFVFAQDTVLRPMVLGERMALLVMDRDCKEIFLLEESAQRPIWQCFTIPQQEAQWSLLQEISHEKIYVQPLAAMPGQILLAFIAYDEVQQEVWLLQVRLNQVFKRLELTTAPERIITFVYKPKELVIFTSTNASNCIHYTLERESGRVETIYVF